MLVKDLKPYSPNSYTTIAQNIKTEHPDTTAIWQGQRNGTSASTEIIAFDMRV
jgi:hypothetical protein